MNNLKPIHLFSIEGNRQWLDGGAMFGNAPKPVWEKWTPPDSRNRIALSCRCLLLEINGRKILCETGIGSFFEPKLAERFGVENPDRHMLLENLKSIGVLPEQIDFVVLSHLHFDHAGGLLPSYSEIAKNGAKLVFPNAKFLVSKDAWDRAINPHPRDKASFIPEIAKLLQESGRLQLVTGKTHPGFFEQQIEFVFSNGHTPGQMHTLIKGPNASILFAGDLIPGTSWVHTSITMGYDRNAELIIDEKLNLYQDLSENSRWVFYTHDTEYCASMIKKSESGKYEAQNPVKSFKGTLI
jgi:glyoxylase-like metal-dependent hydrolase (beta-lactamase superfamily II)